MLKTKSIRYIFLLSFFKAHCTHDVIGSGSGCVLQPRSIYFKRRTATFSTGPRFTPVQKTRRPVPATATALASAPTLSTTKTVRKRRKTQRQYKTVNTHAFKQTAQQTHTASKTPAGFHVLESVLYIFVFPFPPSSNACNISLVWLINLSFVCIFAFVDVKYTFWFRWMFLPENTVELNLPCNCLG